MTLTEVNAWERDRFVAELGSIFESAPWVAERAWSRRPFADLDHLHAAMTAAVAAARPDEVLALLCAHPDLGARTRMSEASVEEQAGAGLDQLTEQEYRELGRLTAAYRQRFGFPFLFAVQGRTKADVLAALSTRLSSSAAEEQAEALAQVSRIARMRLQSVLT